MCVVCLLCCLCDLGHTGSSFVPLVAAFVQQCNDFSVSGIKSHLEQVCLLCLLFLWLCVCVLCCVCVGVVCVMCVHCLLIICCCSESGDGARTDRARQGYH